MEGTSRNNFLQSFELTSHGVASDNRLEEKMSSKEERQALRGLGATEREMLEVIEEWEKYSIVGLAQLCAALAQPIVTFVTFSCLGSIKGKEELLLNLFQTYFFRSRKFEEAVKLIKQLRKLKPVRMIAILPDMEPRRTWGWNVPQSELTAGCEMMIYDGHDIPAHWDLRCWSHIETCSSHRYEDATMWVDQPSQALVVHQEAEYLRHYPDILFQGGVHQAAGRQVAAYAHEGRVLEEIHLGAILLQSESPFARKDRMYQPLRKTPLSIIHPFEE